MNTKPFDPTKPVQTRDGRKARIVCADVKGTGPYSIIALITDPSGSEHSMWYLPNGCNSKSIDNPSDLINIPVKREGWVNVYPPSECWRPDTLHCISHICSQVYRTKDYADQSSGGRLACVRIEWEE